MKIVGVSKPIHDAKLKAAGKAIYAGDMSLPGMLHAALLFSDIPHGIIKSIDISEAIKIPGVVDIIHCFNTAGRMFNRFRTTKGQDVIEQEQVFSSHVRFVGDRVACVIAENIKTAKEAVKHIKVEYEELPFTTDMQEALNGKIDNIYETGSVYGDINIQMGEDIKTSDSIEVSTTSALSRLTHIAMEPHACVASYEKELNELTIWSPNQSVHGIRTVIAEIFELPYEKVRVIKTTMGGSFGSKQEWMLEPVAAAAALKVGKPVKLVFSRSEVMISTICRCEVDAKFTAMIDANGKIRSIKADATLNAGAYLGNSYDYAAAIASKFSRCYDIPYVNYTARAVCTNTPVSGAYRGWGAPEMFIMLEHNLNAAARKLGMDPVELRLKNVLLPGDIDKKSGKTLGEIRIKECIELGREKFEWDKKKEQNKTFNEQNIRFKRGIGIGCGGHVNGYYPRTQDFAGVEMRMTESGGVIVNIALHDHGCGTITAFQIIVAECLGVPMEKICIKEADSGYSPFDVGCFASRTTYVLGKAAYDCAEKLKDLIVSSIAQIHEINSDDLIIVDETIRNKKDDSVMYTYAEAATKIFRTLQKEVWVKHQHINNTNPGVTGAHFAQVEVDTYTGKVKILNYLAVHDIGKAINPEMCIAQIQGAVIMGSGAALTEDLRVNSVNGKPFTSMKDYHVINITEVPNIQVELIEDGQTEGPFGAKSIGEACHVPVAPTVIGAVNDALQSDLCNIPLNPDTIVAFIKSRREK